MTGEFRAFDVKYAANKGKTFDNICKEMGRPAKEDVNLKRWDDYMPGWNYVVHGREQIRDAVYRAPGAEDWQKFRVGLHGLTTQQKLYCLAWYWSSPSNTDYWYTIRVDNYLGALIRGGQLNSALEIVK